MRRQLLVSLAVATLLLVTAGIAMAQATNYPPTTPPTSSTATADDQKNSVAPGDIQRLEIEGAKADTPVTATCDCPDDTTMTPEGDGTMPQFQAMSVLALTTVSATTNADASGTATFLLRIPKDAPNGTYTWRATGTGADGLPFSISGSFAVDSSLPITGGNVSRGAVLAVVALVVGAGLVLLGRRRSGNENHVPVA